MYLARRLLHSLFLFFTVSVLTFILANLAPGKFFDELRTDSRIAISTVSGLEIQYGLNRSLPVQYYRWLESAIRGDFGFSLAYQSAAGPIIWTRAMNTLALTASATLLAWFAAFPLGVWSAAKSGKMPDLLAKGTVSTLLAVPDATLALLLLLVAVKSQYFPAGGATGVHFSQLDFWSKSRDVVAHLFLPTICLTLSLLPVLLAHVRSAMIEAQTAPFVAAAHAHGIAPLRLRLRYVFPAAANSLISLLGLSFGILLSSSIIVEGVFGWPGLGRLLIDAILQRDFYLVVDATVLGAAFLIAGNFLADMLLYAVDPRIR
jgi:peptide/nickel transport system permease protein